jgi:Flavin containing amine oxidoreductase
MMKRLFHLFNCKQLNPHDNPRDPCNLRSHLAEYRPGTNKGFFLYNGIRCRIGEEPAPPADFFKFGVNNGGDVEEDFIHTGHNNLLRETFKGFADALTKDIESDPPRKDGWNKLMRFDQYSVRGYMADCMKLSYSAINWLETRGKSTGGFDLSLAQTVLSTLPLRIPSKWFRLRFVSSSYFPSPSYVFLRGGSQVLPDYMTAYIEKNAGRNALQRNKTVIGINAPNGNVIEVSVRGEATACPFQHVISTVSLACLRKFKLDDGLLNYHQRQALRQLQCDAAVKIGIKFKSAWWKERFDIAGDHSYTDRNVRIVGYPWCPSSTVLIASYVNTRDATQLGGFIGAGKDDEQLKKLVLEDLAAIHDVPFDYLQSEYVAHFAFDWHQNPLSRGKPHSLGSIFHC